jgi:hypothetical protein
MPSASRDRTAKIGLPENAKFVYRSIYSEFQIVIGQDSTLPPVKRKASQVVLEDRDSAIYLKRSRHPSSFNDFSLTSQPSSSRPESPFHTPHELPAYYEGTSETGYASTRHDPKISTFQQVYAALIGYAPLTPQTQGKERLLLQTEPCDDALAARHALSVLVTIEVHKRLTTVKNHSLTLEKLSNVTAIMEKLPDDWRLVLHSEFGMVCFADDNTKTMSWQLPEYPKIEKLAIASTKEKVLRETVAESAAPPPGYKAMYYQGGNHAQVTEQFEKEEARRVNLAKAVSKEDDALSDSSESSITSSEYKNHPSRESSCVIL